ncbi:MAG: flavodoxin family protein [Clostridiales bacterium]|jgi:flavodoxin|nr:flavodoxin family protein [Clostridiales bacterium]
MKNLIVVYSYHHGNTKKLAEVIAKEINAQIIELPQSDGLSADYEIIGFGAGIDSGHHYKELLEYAEELPQTDGKIKAFIFSTAGIYKEKKTYKDHTQLRDILIKKGFEIIGEFACSGFDTNSVLKLFGGINKEHPNDNDLDNAKTFAKSLIK